MDWHTQARGESLLFTSPDVLYGPLSDDNGRSGLGPSGRRRRDEWSEASLRQDQGVNSREHLRRMDPPSLQERTSIAPPIQERSPHRPPLVSNAALRASLFTPPQPSSQNGIGGGGLATLENSPTKVLYGHRSATTWEEPKLTYSRLLGPRLVSGSGAFGEGLPLATPESTVRRPPSATVLPDVVYSERAQRVWWDLHPREEEPVMRSPRESPDRAVPPPDDDTGNCGCSPRSRPKSPPPSSGGRSAPQIETSGGSTPARAGDEKASSGGCFGRSKKDKDKDKDKQSRVVAMQDEGVQVPEPPPERGAEGARAKSPVRATGAGGSDGTGAAAARPVSSDKSTPSNGSASKYETARSQPVSPLATTADKGKEEPEGKGGCCGGKSTKRKKAASAKGSAVSANAGNEKDVNSKGKDAGANGKAASPPPTPKKEGGAFACFKRGKEKKKPPSAPLGTTPTAQDNAKKQPAQAEPGQHRSASVSPKRDSRPTSPPPPPPRSKEVSSPRPSTKDDEAKSGSCMPCGKKKAKDKTAPEPEGPDPALIAPSSRDRTVASNTSPRAISPAAQPRAKTPDPSLRAKSPERDGDAGQSKGGSCLPRKKTKAATTDGHDRPASPASSPRGRERSPVREEKRSQGGCLPSSKKKKEEKQRRQEVEWERHAAGPVWSPPPRSPSASPTRRFPPQDLRSPDGTMNMGARRMFDTIVLPDWSYGNRPPVKPPPPFVPNKIVSTRLPATFASFPDRLFSRVDVRPSLQK